METIKNIIAQFSQLASCRPTFEGEHPQIYGVVNPQELEVCLKPCSKVSLVVLHDEAVPSKINFKVGDGAHLELVDLYLADVETDLHIEQEASSLCHVSTIALSSAKNRYVTDLNGCGAESALHGLFLLEGEEHYSMSLRTNHNVADCVSNSSVKGVAGGQAEGNFYGLVYVAQDAQRTDAQQQSRNILLSKTARIDTKPQLEIYADDVKCTHGATVGQMDDEAILYMRQRGLSEMQARSLQVEGFVSDVVLHCGVEALSEAMMARLVAKLAK